MGGSRADTAAPASGVNLAVTLLQPPFQMLGPWTAELPRVSVVRCVNFQFNAAWGSQCPKGLMMSLGLQPDGACALHLLGIGIRLSLVPQCAIK